jgi:hypothetical protein
MLFGDILSISTCMGNNTTQISGQEAGFDKNDQFQHLIIDPGDIKSKQQQPGLLYVATSRAKTIREITPDMKHPKTSIHLTQE